MKENNYLIPAVEKAIGVLECLCGSPSPMGVSELTRELNPNKNMEVVGALGITVLTLHCSRKTLLSELAGPVREAARAASEILGADMGHVLELATVEVWK